MRKLKLTTTTDQVDALHSVVHKTERQTTTVKVDKAALTALLLDHTRLLQWHRGEFEEAPIP